MERNVLIVDDCAVMQTVIARILEMSSLDIGSILKAGNGREGMEILKESEIGLVILDINMPVMDGLQMLEEIRSHEETRNVPVLIVSAESHQQRVKFVASMGSGYIQKPFTPELLSREVEKICLDYPFGEQRTGVNPNENIQ